MIKFLENEIKMLLRWNNTEQLFPFIPSTILSIKSIEYTVTTELVKYLKGIPAWQSEPFLEFDWWLMLIWWFHPPEYSLKIQHFLWLILHSVLTIFYKIQLQNVIKNYLFGDTKYNFQYIIYNMIHSLKNISKQIKERWRKWSTVT